MQGDEREHPERLEQELLATLGRVELLGSLPRLLMNQLVVQRHLEKRSLDVPFMSLKRFTQAADEETDAREAKTIQEVCVPFNRTLAPPIFQLDRVISQIEDALDAVPPQSVLLVGPSGVGKTVAVWGVAARRDVVSTSGSRLVAGQMGFGMWQDRCMKLLREVAERKLTLHLGNLVELMEVGRSEHNQLGIAEFLRPALARGKPLAVAECTAEQLAHIERSHPQILQAFRVVEVPEPDGPVGRSILAAYVEHLSAKSRIGVESVALIDRLHRRYATYSAYPGRPMRFVRRLLQDNPPTPLPVGEGETISATPKTIARPLDAKEILDAFTRETGLPRLLLDDAMPFDVDEVRSWFRERVIGQGDAVTQVVDLLVTIKAGLARPNRPLASFLFIGPTGVGKTEMAKAIAEFIFGSRERITRFDMSEYADPRAIQRLIGDGYGGEGLLTSRIREQPFSIILLDEFEKAHPAFFDLLLQMCGEARLTDGMGRLADFRNAVIILTSNLGAESYQQGGVGFGAATHDANVSARDHFTRALQGFLRPEMIGRLGRVIPFMPLGRETIERIARREWEMVLGRDGIFYRGIQVETGPGVVPRLAEIGFDPRYGARPLKRAIEQQVLAPLAHRLNSYSGEFALEVSIDAGAKPGEWEIDCKPQTDDGGQLYRVMEAGSPFARVIQEVTQLRQSGQKLQTCTTMREMRNQHFRLTQEVKRFQKAMERKQKLPARMGQVYQQLEEFESLILDSDRHLEALLAFEMELKLLFYEANRTAHFYEESFSEPYFRRHAAFENEWRALLMHIFTVTNRENPGKSRDAATVVLHGPDPDWLATLADVYIGIARGLGQAVSGYGYYRPTKRMEDEILDSLMAEEAGDASEATKFHGADDAPLWFGNQLARPSEVPTVLARRRELSPARDIPTEPANEKLIAVLLRIEGDGSGMRFNSEMGLHTFDESTGDDGDDAGKSTWLAVRPTDQKSNAYVPGPEVIVPKDAEKGVHPWRRTYNRPKKSIRDAMIRPRTRVWKGGTDDLQEAVSIFMESRIQQLLEEMLTQ